MVRRAAIGWLISLLMVAGCRAEKFKQSSEEAEITVTPPPTGTITGEVGASGEPLVGARVCARREIPTLDLVREDVEASCTSTNAAGGFELQLGAGIYFVIASAEQHLPGGQQVVLRFGEPGERVSLELVPGGREYVGSVVDLDRQPIAGAKVSHVFSLGPRRHHGVEVETDEQGRYRFWSTREGVVRVTASSYARVSVTERDGQQFLLLPESSIAGTVVDRDGRPVANARVIVEDGGFASPVWGWPDHAVHTDAEGRFRLTQLRPDSHFVAALSPDRELTGTASLHVGLAEQREGVVLTLDLDAHRYHALIVDAESGAPVAGCRAELKLGDETSGATAWVDEQGRLDVPLPSDEYKLVVLACPGYVASKPFPVIGPDPSAPVRVEVYKGVELHGLVVDELERPVVGYPVAIGPRDSEYEDGLWPAETMTDARGRFTLTGLARRVYLFSGDPLSGESQSQKVNVGEQPTEPVILRVPVAERIEVAVGAEHAGRWVAVRDCDEDRPSSWGPGWLEIVEIEPNGLAVIERAPLGSYRLGLYEFGSDACGDGGIPIEVSGDRITRVRLELEDERPSLPVRVRVSNSTGEPVSGAVVSMKGSDEPITASDWALNQLRVQVTDAQGVVSFPEYHNERFTVVAARPGLFGARVVDGEAATREIEIRLRSLE